MSVDHTALAISAFNRALDSIESAKRELSLGRSALALLDAARALEAAGKAHYQVAMQVERGRR